MKKIVSLKTCSGCFACVNACPKGCVIMETDKEGFWYPEIDEKNCINCGLCEKTCPILKDYEGNLKGRAYACINKDENIRMQSSSGGVFTLLAEYVLEKGGVVFGAAFDEEFAVQHIAVDNIEDLEKLRGSKYLQSKIGDTYKQAKILLDGGRWVLFSGTPCQTSGLKSYLGKDYENLIMQDIICHGVPSPKVWERYVKFREAKAASQTRRTFFRDKKYGWKMYSILFDFANSTEYIKILPQDFYMRAFLANLCLRSSCYECHSKSLNRESDITLADFWGIENVAPDMDDDKGTSLVFVNSVKGENLFSSIKEKIIYKEVDIDEAVKYNLSAYRSVTEPSKRRKFMKDIFEKDFGKIVEKYTKISIYTRTLRKVKRIMKQILKKRGI